MSRSYCSQNGIVPGLTLMSAGPSFDAGVRRSAFQFVTAEYPSANAPRAAKRSRTKRSMSVMVDFHTDRDGEDRGRRDQKCEKSACELIERFHTTYLTLRGERTTKRLSQPDIDINTAALQIYSPTCCLETNLSWNQCLSKTP